MSTNDDLMLSSQRSRGQNPAKTMTSLFGIVKEKNKLSLHGSKISQHDESPLHDSVLGDNNRDILLKAVIQKAEWNSKRIEVINDRIWQHV